MKVSSLTINALNPYVTGDNSIAPRMTGAELIVFFNEFGCSDKYTRSGLPNNWSRREYTDHRLKELNGSPEFKKLIEALIDSRKVEAPDSISLKIAELIKHDGYLLKKNELEIYKVEGTQPEDPISIEAHFEEIKENIINSIENARFTIWIAVAWFTDKDIGNALWRKHKAGVNVRVVVNDDENTNKYGLKFNTQGELPQNTSQQVS